MAEYIERETFLKDIEERYCLPCKEVGKDHNGFMCRACWVDDMRGDVIDAPAADVSPVVHGRWIEQSRLYYGANQYECSLCYSDTFWKKHSINEKYPHCPNCGCRMDGGDDE